MDHRLAATATRSVGPLLACIALALFHGASAASGIVIHDAQTTLRDRCQRDADGILWLVLPGGARFELIESVNDPAIVNRGDGQFHPFDAAEVRSALAQVRYPIESLRADVFVLPFPRRNGLESAAAPGLVLLSPGVRPLSVEHQHSEFVHEIGHVVQYAMMPDADAARWSHYRRLRGIQDDQVYAAWSPHANRPHEIFAEDFRALFGGAAANYSGTIENPALAHPATVPGLAAFIAGLAETRLAGVTVRAAANPAYATVRFESGQPLAGPLEIVDIAGRRITTILPVRVAAGVEWTWDRRDADGVRVGPGVVFARTRGQRTPAARVVLAP